MKHWIAGILGLITVFASVTAQAQSTSELRGRVVDPGHHPVVSAFAVITSQDVSLMRAASSDEQGEFEFAALPVGTYHLQVTADGFLLYDTGDIRASIGQVVTVEVVLSQKQAALASHRTTGLRGVETANTQVGVVMNNLDVNRTAAEGPRHIRAVAAPARSPEHPGG